MSAPAGNPQGASVPRRFAPDVERRLAEIRERLHWASFEIEQRRAFGRERIYRVTEQERRLIVDDIPYLLELLDRADMEHDALRLIAEQGRPDGGAA